MTLLDRIQEFIMYRFMFGLFDRENALHSIPARLGIKGALNVSSLFHVLAFAGFFGVGLSSALPSAYFVGVIVLGILLIGQHLIVSPNRMDRINHAFFTFNGIISVVYFFLVLAVLY